MAQKEHMMWPDGALPRVAVREEVQRFAVTDQRERRMQPWPARRTPWRRGTGSNHAETSLLTRRTRGRLAMRTGRRGLRRRRAMFRHCFDDIANLPPFQPAKHHKAVLHGHRPGVVMRHRPR